VLLRVELRDTQACGQGQAEVPEGAKDDTPGHAHVAAGEEVVDEDVVELHALGFHDREHQRAVAAEGLHPVLRRGVAHEDGLLRAELVVHLALGE